MSVLLRLLALIQAFVTAAFAVPVLGPLAEYWAACLSSLVRLGPVLPAVGKSPPQPARPIVLYEYEGCPFCAKVRVACDGLSPGGRCANSHHSGAHSLLLCSHARVAPPPPLFFSSSLFACSSRLPLL